MIPLSKLRKEHQNKATVGVATDSADTACACDAAPKKPQTLQQHLKQYHGGKMPTGDCKFLKQYKKDHPDWQSEVPTATKGESDIDTVKKDAKPKKGAWDYSVEDINSDDLETAKGALAKFIAERNMRMAPASYKKQSEKDAELKKVRDEIEKTAKGETGDATWYAQCLAAYHTRGMKEMAYPYNMPLIKAMQEAEKKTGNTDEAKMDALRKNIEARKAKEGKKDEGKKDGDDDDLLGAELMDEIKKNPLFDVKSPKKGVFSVRRGKGIRAFDNMGWDILNEMRKTFGKDAIDSLGTPSVFENYVQFSGVLPKKSAAEEYVDSVKKDAKKSEKKDGKSSDVRLPQYPSKEDMKKNFDFDKAEKTIMDSVSSTGDITDIDSDILGDGCLTLSFGLKKGSKFGKPSKELLGDALEKMGIPRSAMEDPIPGTREDSAIVVVKLDALIKQNDDDDIESAESLLDNNSADDLEAMFSDDSRKTCVDGARKQAAKTGYSYDVTWSPNTGWGFIKHYKGNLSKGQTVLGTVSNDFDDKGVRLGAQFHRNTDFDSKKPVERYKEIQEALDARKTALAKGEDGNGDSGKGGSAEPVEYPKTVMDAVEKERAKAPVDDTDWTDEEADKFVELTDGIYQQDFDNTEVETHKGFAIVWNKMGAWRVELDKGKVTDLC